MHRVFFLISLLFMCTAVCADKTITPYGSSTIDFTVSKLPGLPVYYVTGYPGVPGAVNQGLTSNAGFVVTSKGVVVYDALGTPVLGYRLLQAIRSVTDKPVKLVIAGHYHADHVYGLQAFREHTQAQIWAHQDSAIYLQSDRVDKRLEQRRESLFPWVNDNTYVVRPDKLYSDRKLFNMGDTNIELIHAGKAHAPDDTIMIIHEHGVIFSGDLIFSGRLPYLGGGGINTRNWLARLDYLETLKHKTKYIISGHGELDKNPEVSINFTRKYIGYLRDVMGKAANEMLAFDEAYQSTDWSAYKNISTFHATNRVNAYQVFLEMETESFSGK